ncbi:ATP synthase mitochondrial F1 complex assembly factor 2 [Venturia canescens]|uniref:ATP synthase mitochondrial F1 complex assembly factor 2 n=1 Tax=Venturia canescens TaxID=32260 RepID=UPI001C9C369B|nr:ATP synthase mitochondrial F1 complex assembly factor 2 [Venturia canescens]XP_043274449.1 ATP synthase mitochondrial F1 complex assembly factor 2 [Venturia canescens]XP_043274450.1 ATP synthase mitochondrial F1 complex assembly factor 2 [Venturia canescens]XP_043274451.1 ATP synthase mitochondrial F1 complex assembly factor 2 [Venturia canescens]XP_043274452.1 ATP synthase mitochondrial F1 complex assembly factor 2 [Venturia canescens]
MFYSKCRQFVPKAMAVRNMATVKRFYRRTNILASGDKFEITLDQRKLKTPKGKVFEVSSKPLALAVALEWDSQEDIIDRSNMHLTALCSTYLDNPHQHTRIDIANYIANYLETDTVLFHSSETDELFNVQAQKWDPIIQWFCDRYQVDITKTQSISPPDVPMETKATIIRHMVSYSEAALQGFLYSVDTLKSVILTMAVCDRKISVEEAVSLSRLEEEFQISHWGNVEWSHDLSKQDLQGRLAAATLFIHLSSYNTTSQPKNERINTA